MPEGEEAAVRKEAVEDAGEASREGVIVAIEREGALNVFRKRTRPPALAQLKSGACT